MPLKHSKGMMKLAKELDREKFRRLTGVKRSTFDQMVSILEISHKIKKARGGQVNKLKIEDMLLMTLKYLREPIFT